MERVAGGPPFPILRLANSCRCRPWTSCAACTPVVSETAPDVFSDLIAAKAAPGKLLVRQPREMPAELLASAGIGLMVDVDLRRLHPTHQAASQGVQEPA